MQSYIHPDIGLFIASVVVFGIYVRLYFIMERPGGRFFISLVGILLFVIASFLNWFEETPYEYLMLAYTDEEGWDFIIPVFFYAPGGFLTVWGFAEWTRLALSLKAEIGQRVETEEKLRTALHEAAQANELKKQFIQALKHELRTPLDALVGFSEILKLQQKQSGDETRDSYYADIINRSSANLLRITDDLVQLGTLGDAEFQVNRKTVNIYPLLRGVSLAFQQAVPNRVPVRIPATEATAILDQDLIERLLVRLLVDLDRLISTESKITLSFQAAQGTQEGQENEGISNLICLWVDLPEEDDLLDSVPGELMGDRLRAKEMNKALGLTHVLLALADHLMAFHGGSISAYIISKHQFRIDLALE